MDFRFKKGLSEANILIVFLVILLMMVLVTYWTQNYIDRDIISSIGTLPNKSVEYKNTKLLAEISKIRSDTTGSLFWLKLIALFVTVGGAVGGYLMGQSYTTKVKLAFEDRKIVDEVYQSIIQELADDSSILRAAAAVKLGTILKSFPSEWNVSNTRKKQIIQLTKQVLAAALSIEKDPKVLKTITISIVLHKTNSDDGLTNVQELDLSGAKAKDAYWARCNFEYADFYAAKLSRASFRKSNISGAQFREAKLRDTVFAESICNDTNFKMADLRGASFERANLNSVNFENAKVYSVSLKKATINNYLDCQVDISKEGDGSQLIGVSEWIESSQN
jgi:hypothetical protein